MPDGSTIIQNGLRYKQWRQQKVWNLSEKQTITPMGTAMQKMMNGLVQCRAKPLRPRKGKVCLGILIPRHIYLIGGFSYTMLIMLTKLNLGLSVFLFCLILVLEFERVYLDNLPSAAMYERSYMHRDVITHIVCTK